MAGREKKPALSKKLAPSPVPPKEGAAHPENVAADAKEMPNIVTAAKRKPMAKRTIKRKLRVGFKPAKKKPALRISKAIFSVAQASLDAKKAALIKNGITAPKRIRKPKGQTVPATKVTIKADPNDEPPVLEPMEPLPSENGLQVEKNQPKKRSTKKTASVPPEIQDENKPTLELEGTIETPKNSTDQPNATEVTTKRTVKKGKVAKKVKEEAMETLDDVMNDLSEHINLDTDILKINKVTTRKSKVDSPKRKTIKKENIITLNKDLSHDSSVTKVIDMLDLNVSKRPKKQLVRKRRHSIEKFPATHTEGSDNTAINAFQLFPNTPRSVSPRSKRGSKIRQSVDNTITTKRSSPYTTRSDSPARILRNGKQRKLKDFLLEGIETSYQKRRRLCSDLSGSEMSISRNSGFESDTSSYSDLAPHLDNSDVSDTTTQKDAEGTTKSMQIKKEIIEPTMRFSSNCPIPEEVKHLDIKSISTKFTAILKRSLSTEAAVERQLGLQAAANGALETAQEKPPNVDNNITDTNSNLCNDVKPDISKMTPDIPIKAETIEDFSDNQSVNIKLCPDSKVPEKNFILDIMKQTFNEVEEQEKERRPTRSSARIKKTADKSEERASAKSEDKTAAKVEDKAAAKSEQKTAAKSEEKATAKPEEKATAKPEEKATAKSEQNAAAKSEENIAAKPEEKVVAKSEENPIVTAEEKAAPISEEKTSVTTEEKAVVEPAEISANKSEEIVADTPEENHANEPKEKSEIEMSVLKFYGAPTENSEKESSENQTPILDTAPDKINAEETEAIPELIEAAKSEDAEEKPIVVEENKPEEIDIEAIIEIEEVESKSELQSEILMKALVAETAEYVEKTLLGKALEPDVSKNNEEVKIVDLDPCTNGDKEIPDEKMDVDVEIVVDDATDDKPAAVIDETPENLAKKENILQALGLQSLRAAAEAKLREKVVPKQESYTGTLKTVIKINRGGLEKKGRRNSLKMTIHKKGKNKDGNTEFARLDDDSNYRISKEVIVGLLFPAALLLFLYVS